jgi:hypothetical protein
MESFNLFPRLLLGNEESASGIFSLKWELYICF